MASVISIDLGSSSVKLVLSGARSGRGGESLEQRSRPVAVSGATASPLGARLAALDALLQDLGPQEGALWATSLGAESVSVRLVDMPFADREQIGRALPFELEGLVPFDLADFLLDWRISELRGGGARVFAALAPKAEVGALLGGLDAIDVDPRLVMLDTDALGALARGPGVTAVVDVGHSRTLLSVARDGQTLGARALSFGGGALTVALAQALTLPDEEAEALKLGLHLGGAMRPEAISVAPEAPDEQVTPSGQAAPPDLEKALAALRDGITPWLAELRGSLIGLEDELGVGIDELVLCGGGALLGGLPELLAAELGVPVRRVELSGSLAVAMDAPRLALAQAVAQRAAAGGTSLSFRQGEFAFRGDVAILRSAMGYALVAVGFFAVAALAMFAVRAVGLSQDTDAVQEEIAGLVTGAFPEVTADRAKQPGMARTILLEKNDALRARVEALSAVVGQDPPVLSLLKEISEQMPAHPEVVIDVKEMSLSAKAVSFKAETNGFESAAKIEEALQRFDRFKQARKGDEKKAGDNVSFSMTIPLGEAPQEGAEGEEG
ncbi:MAG: pilus assembly protein PilM [Deltaproteobacteria bacterium]|nr:pilus assembly protein PilM [Deltaproteobacteria bacterium]